VINASQKTNIAPLSVKLANSHVDQMHPRKQSADWPLASCLIFAWTLLEYVIIIMWLRSVIKMLGSVKFAEDKVLTFHILREKC